MNGSLRSWNIREDLLADENIVDSFSGEALEDKIDDVSEEVYACVECASKT